MRTFGTIAIASMMVAWLALGAIPAQADTFVDTQSFVNSAGNTVTVTDTYEINGSDVVLVSRDMTETRPDGALLVAKSWDFYPSGAVMSSEETRNSSVAPTTIHRDYAEDGTLLFQRSEMSLNGGLALVVLTEYDAEGYLVSQEERKLITLADGTQVWEVTESTYAQDGSVASRTVEQYPSSHNFDAPPVADPPAEQPPADQVPVIDQPPADEPAADDPPAEQPAPDANQPPADQPSADQPAADQPPADQPSADDTERQRPGWGRGDKNHEHTGPGGMDAADARGDRSGQDVEDDDDDDRDDDVNGKQKDKSKDRNEKGKHKDKDNENNDD